MRERGLTNVGNLQFSGASRWSASESFRVGDFSTGQVGKFTGSSALLVDRDTPLLHKTGLSENVLSSKSKWLLPPALCLYRFFQIHHA